MDDKPLCRQYDSVMAEFETPRESGDDSELPPLFSMRIVSLEQRMRRPIPGLDFCFSELSGTCVERVPVITVFGSTSAGQSTCLHVHKVLRFLFRVSAADRRTMIGYALLLCPFPHRDIDRNR